MVASANRDVRGGLLPLLPIGSPQRDRVLVVGVNEPPGRHAECVLVARKLDPVLEGGQFLAEHADPGETAGGLFHVGVQLGPEQIGARIGKVMDLLRRATSDVGAAERLVCVVLLIRREAVYVLDVIRERMDYPVLRRTALSSYKRWRGTGLSCSLVIENKGSGMSLIQDLRRQNIFALAVNPGGDKIMRMHGQTARIEAGGVLVPTRAPWLDEFRREVLIFPHGRYDDQVDALAQGLSVAFVRRVPIAATGQQISCR